MAYLRDKKETLEIDYPLEKIWEVIPKAVKNLQWTIEEKDDVAYTSKIKTNSGFLAYSTLIKVEAKSVDKNTTRMEITGETPVTTITSILDFGRTDDRVGLFIETLAKLMEDKKKTIKSD